MGTADFWIYTTNHSTCWASRRAHYLFHISQRKCFTTPRVKPPQADHVIYIGVALHLLSAKAAALSRLRQQRRFITFFMTLLNETPNPRRNNLFDVEWANAREVYSSDLHWQKAGQSTILEQAESQLKSLCYKRHQACQFNFKAVQKGKRELYI